MGVADTLEQGHLKSNYSKGLSTGKSLSEALISAEHGENMLCT